MYRPQRAAARLARPQLSLFSQVVHSHRSGGQGAAGSNPASPTPRNGVVRYDLFPR
jgi:hypothetical protein